MREGSRLGRKRTLRIVSKNSSKEPLQSQGYQSRDKNSEATFSIHTARNFDEDSVPLMQDSVDKEN